MATNEPLVPSMIFKSRTTYASSNVTEQNAWRRSFSVLSSMSLIRTSVMTTSVLLLTVAHSFATTNHENTGLRSGLPSVAQAACYVKSVVGVTGQCEHRAAAAAHHRPNGCQLAQPLQPVPDLRTQPLRRRLQAVVQAPTQLRDVARLERLADARAFDHVARQRQLPEDAGGGQSDLR